MHSLFTYPVCTLLTVFVQYYNVTLLALCNIITHLCTGIAKHNEMKTIIFFFYHCHLDKSQILYFQHSLLLTCTYTNNKLLTKCRYKSSSWFICQTKLHCLLSWNNIAFHNKKYGWAFDEFQLSRNEVCSYVSIFICHSTLQKQ